tara:strand:+ start:472 stop:660 length:189 start_codon:yes stop_codon:yes gene_type:complete
MSSPDPKLIIDTAIATGMVTTPIWLQWVEQSLQLFMLIGGSILLIARLWSVFIKKKGTKKDG